MSLPSQRAFLQGVDVGEGEDAGEAGHAGEGGRIATGDEVAELDGPRIHEDDFNVEDDEKHRDEVELHREARSAIADREHAAFVGGVLGGVAFGGLSEDDAESQGHGGEAGGHQNLEEDGKELIDHRRDWLFDRGLVPGCQVKNPESRGGNPDERMRIRARKNPLRWLRPGRV